MTLRLWCAGWLLCVVMVAGCSLSRPQMVSGVLHGQLLWRGTVLIDGDVVLDGDATLTITPGTEILFLSPSPDRDRFIDHPHFSGSELIVKGRLRAEGTAAQPIRFAYRDPTAPAGAWGGINLVESPFATFRFCSFRQADSAVHSQKSRVEIESCRFSDNLVGLRFHDSPLRIERSTLSGNGTAIRFHGGAPAIRHNELRDNDKALFITATPRDYLIESNNIVGSRRFSVALGEEVADDVLLRGNWWGTTAGAEIETGFFDGRRSEYLGRILYQPWLGTPLADAGAPWNR